jgi:hypothetical protein
VGAENKLVDVLDKILVELLALLLLIDPVVCVGLGINTVDLLVVLNKSIDGIFCELVGDLISQNHVDVNDISLNVNELIVHDSLDQGVGSIPLEI